MDFNSTSAYFTLTSGDNETVAFATQTVTAGLINNGVRMETVFSICTFAKLAARDFTGTSCFRGCKTGFVRVFKTSIYCEKHQTHINLFIDKKKGINFDRDVFYHNLLINNHSIFIPGSIALRFYNYKNDGHSSFIFFSLMWKKKKG